LNTFEKFIPIQRLGHWTLLTTFGNFATSSLKWSVLTLFGGPDVNALPNTWHLDAGVTWTLRFEALFYVFLPVLAFLFTRAKPWLAGVVGLVLTFLVWRFADFSHEPQVGPKLLPFLSGILAAYLSRNPRLVTLFKTRAVGLIALAVILAVLFVAPRGYHPLTVTATTIIFFAAVVENRMFSALRTAPVSRLGEISYGVYLMHGLLLWWGTHLLGDLIVAPIAYAGFLLIIAVILVSTCWLTHILIEIPGIAAGLRFGPRSKKKSGPPSSRPQSTTGYESSKVSQ
jgi:peptidoglycan/LPS O-acetylase OafA/YrhL